MAEYIDKDTAIVKAVHCIDNFDPIAHDIAKAIDAIPPADVVERKHGMWVLYNKGFGFTHYCSNCNFEVKEQWIDLYNFCPNCGYDMRESEEEDG